MVCFPNTCIAKLYGTVQIQCMLFVNEENIPACIVVVCGDVVVEVVVVVVSAISTLSGFTTNTIHDTIMHIYAGNWARTRQ